MSAKKSLKPNPFLRIDNALPPALPFSEGENVFTVVEYAEHAQVNRRTASERLTQKLLPSGVVRRVRTKRNGKLTTAWEMVG